MRQRKTCDRCYKIKARCMYDDCQDSCVRCLRLGHDCSGKPASLLSEKTAKHIDGLSHDGDHASQRTGRLIRVNELSLWPTSLAYDETACIDFLLQPDQISSLLYGKNFLDSMRSAMAAPIFIAADQVKDGYAALAGAIFESRTRSSNQLAVTSHPQRSSKGLQVLRAYKSASVADARVALSLALVLVTYNDLVVGGPTLPIARSALLQAQPFQKELVQSRCADTDPHLICLLFCEVFECLVLSQLPVFRYEVGAETRAIDRYYGICQDLLPYLYDICLLYRSIKEGTASKAWIIAESRKLANMIERWSPVAIIAERTRALHDDVERQHFLLQAKSFKCALELLLMQTQRSPGMDLLARAKAFQLEENVVLSRRLGAGRPKYLLFPYFVACVELYDCRAGQDEEVFSMMNDISNGNAPKSCQTMMALLKYIWQTRQETPNLTWFQCIGDDMRISMGP